MPLEGVVLSNGVRTMRSHALVLVVSVCMWVGLPAYGYAQ